MDSRKIRQKFVSFFEKRGHAIVPSSSLIPDDPSVLLTTAGMQQFKKYYTGEADTKKDFGSPNTASIQKSFRTSDIDEVGDESHLTFFEMLGNFSFGGYFKKEAIKYAFDFITKEMGLAISFVSFFEGSHGVAKDEESKAVWKSLGVTDTREQGIEDVFWGPTGSEGPCGPTTEIYCENAAGGKTEIWNIVFNEFHFPGSREELLSGASGKSLERIKTPGVDTGMGLERLAMVSQNVPTIFETDLFAPLLELLPGEMTERRKRIIIDHLRGSTFLLADGVRPTNKDRGYILRRLMRRALVYERIDKIPPHVFDAIIHDIEHEYGEFYPELMKTNNQIRQEFASEREKFLKTVDRGLRELEKISEIEAKNAFRLYETFGIPFEIIKELGGVRANMLKRATFDEEFRKHQEISRAGSGAKFGGHGLYLKTGEVTIRDKSEVEKVTRLHTATHLLHAGLRAVLGPEVRQDGSDITVNRTRFDFRFPRKVTPEELQKVEQWVNDAIAKNLTVKSEEMSFVEATQKGALGFFREKYPERVKIYTIFDATSGEEYSKELCGGPHVARTDEIGKFKILKEESSSAGVRRIRAEVE